ncbi:MAG: serine/threonine protein kinase [Elusimicrobia bacterium]|nr:serine/threonine protein kinase [Elusimicrobiota bacterium]
MEARVRIGYVIDGYVLEEMIGSGGFSTVYRARSLNLTPKYHSIIAVKVLHPRRLDRWQIRRFVREVKIASRLEHPNIVKVFGVRKQDGNFFSLMELLDVDLLKAIRTKPSIFNNDNVTEIIKKAGYGLEYIHKNAIIHKDVNPSNILITYALDKIKLTDFGLSTKKTLLLSLLHPNGNSSGGGTEGYIAPERIKGKEGDIKSDIFSFGKTMQRIYSELKFEIPENTKYVIDVATKNNSMERFVDMRELLYFLDR